MKKTNYIIFATILFVSCSPINQKIFNNFSKVDTIKLNGLYSKKEINDDDIYILEKTNEKNSFVFNTSVKNFYGFYYKLNNDFVILNYKKEYTANYKPTFSLHYWKDEFLCIYDIKKNEVVSKIMISSTDPIYSKCEYNKDSFVIKSYVRNFRYDEIKNSSYFERDSIEQVYIIKENKFLLFSDSKEMKP